MSSVLLSVAYKSASLLRYQQAAAMVPADKIQKVQDKICTGTDGGKYGLKLRPSSRHPRINATADECQQTQHLQTKHYCQHLQDAL